MNIGDYYVKIYIIKIKQLLVALHIEIDISHHPIFRFQHKTLKKKSSDFSHDRINEREKNTFLHTK